MSATPTWKIGKARGLFGAWEVTLHGTDGAVYPVASGFSSEATAGAFLALYLGTLFRPREESDAEKMLRAYVTEGQH